MLESEVAWLSDFEWWMVVRIDGGQVDNALSFKEVVTFAFGSVLTRT